MPQYSGLSIHQRASCAQDGEKLPMKLTGAQIIWEVLTRRGVDLVFGSNGDLYFTDMGPPGSPPSGT